MISFLFAGGDAWSVTIGELKQLSVENSDVLNTARLSYVKERTDKRGLNAKPDDPYYLFQKIGQHTKVKVDAVVDGQGQRVKKITTDLRDVEKLLKDNDLPMEQKMNVSLSKSMVYENNYEMEFTQASVLGYDSVGLFAAPGPPRHSTRVLDFGTVEPRWLEEEYGAELREIERDGKQVTQIRFVKEGQARIEGVAEIDESLGYRFRNFKLFRDGKLVQEKVADDYRMVGGAVYPFSYVERFYDEAGEVLIETRYDIESAEFGVELSDEDFRLLIPEGARVMDTVLTKTTHTISGDRYMGIGDLFDIESRKIADEMIEDFGAEDIEVVKEEIARIFLPDAQSARKKGDEFVFDLGSSEFIKIRTEGDIEGEDFCSSLLQTGRGDIAWNGRLVVFGGSKFVGWAKSCKEGVEYSRNEWVGLCEFSENIKLPCSVLVIGRDGFNYKVVVERIEGDGIYVSVGKFDSRKTGQYHMLETANF